MLLNLTGADPRRREMVLRLFNMGLRMSGLAAKLLLTLYLGYYFSLADMGTYGLVAACVAISIPLLGFRYDFIVSREIVDAPPLRLASRMRDQMVFYVLNYLVLGLLVAGASLTMPLPMGVQMLLFTLALCVLESFCTVTATNLIFLRQPILSSILFFIRSAAWTVPVIGAGFFWPELRTLPFLFSCWLGGLLASLLATAYVLRHLPWQETLQIPIPWNRIRRDVVRCLPVWIGAVGTIVATNIDRFIVEMHLSREDVGIISFYASFAGAVIGLITSGVSVFKQPQLIALFRQGKHEEFHHTARDMNVQNVAATTVLTLLVGTLVPLLAAYLGKPQLVDHAVVLWLLLSGVWLRMASDSWGSIMYARHQDRATWQGSLLFLLVSAGSNALLVSWVGLNGVGISAVIAGLTIGLWRWQAVRNWQSSAVSISPDMEPDHEA